METQLFSSVMVAVSLLFAAGCTTGSSEEIQASDTINLGNVRSEEAHDVSTEQAEQVSFSYPEHSAMAVRASTYDEGYEPYHVVDGNEETFWRVSSFPEKAIPDKQWIDLEMDSMINLDKLSIQWLGDHEYTFSVYKTRRSDGWRHVLSTKSKGKSEGIETYKLPDSAETRAVHIVFEFDEDAGPRGIRKIRLNGQPWPEAYPLAMHKHAHVEPTKRPYYLRGQNLRGAGRFLSMLNWKQFNLKRPLADGGTARRILDSNEFEGGYIDFDIAVDPENKNWITLKLWESKSQLMTERGNLIALEVFHDHPERNTRWLLPRYMSEEKQWDHEWYGLKPKPGRWVYASYPLPEEVTSGKEHIRLRLQGIGNERRDYPIRAPTPPVYKIMSQTKPIIGASDLKDGEE